MVTKIFTIGTEWIDEIHVLELLNGIRPTYWLPRNLLILTMKILPSGKPLRPGQTRTVVHPPARYDYLMGSGFGSPNGRNSGTKERKAKISAQSLRIVFDILMFSGRKWKPVSMCLTS